MMTDDKRFWKPRWEAVMRSRRPGFGAATPPRSSRGNLGSRGNKLRRAGLAASPDCEGVSPQRFEIEQFPGRTGPDHTSNLHDGTEIRDSQSGVRILFHHEDRQAALPQFVNLLEDLGDELWSESQARFV